MTAQKPHTETRSEALHAGAVQISTLHVAILQHALNMHDYDCGPDLRPELFFKLQVAFFHKFADTAFTAGKATSEVCSRGVLGSIITDVVASARVDHILA